VTCVQLPHAACSGTLPEQPLDKVAECGIVRRVPSWLANLQLNFAAVVPRARESSSILALALTTSSVSALNASSKVRS